MTDVNRRQAGPGNALRRFMTDHFKAVIGTLLTTGALLAVAYVKGVFATPGRLAELTVVVDTVVERQERQGEEFREVATATWTFVALRCLELDDSAFVSSRLPCGKAFLISGIAVRRPLR